MSWRDVRPRIVFDIIVSITMISWQYHKQKIVDEYTLREESSQTNVILQYKLLAEILSAVCSVIQQS